MSKRRKHKSKFRWKDLTKRFSRASRKTNKTIGKVTEGVEGSFKKVERSVGDIFGTIFAIILPKSLRSRFGKLGKSKRAKKLGRRVGQMTDTVEKRFTKGASGFGEVLSFIGAILVPKSFRAGITKAGKGTLKAISGAFKSIGGLIKWILELILPKWAMNRLEQFGKSNKKALRNWTRFSSAWWKSRNFKSLAWSTPAIFLSLPLVTFLTMASVKTDGDKIVHYRRAAFEADKDGDTEMGDLFRLKLRQLGYLRIESQEYLAAAHIARQGDWEEAYRRMKLIAPLFSVEDYQAEISEITEEETATSDANVASNPSEVGQQQALDNATGHIFAHLWICQALLANNIQSATGSERWQTIEDHAKRALMLESDDIWAKYFLIKVDEHRGANVIDRMVALEEEHPQLRMDIMEYYFRIGKQKEGQAYARKLIGYVGLKAKRKRSPIDYIGWAAACQHMGRSRQAREVIFEGQSRFKDSLAVQRTIAKLLTAQVQQTSPTDEAFHDILRHAHIASPTSVAVANRFAERLLDEPARYQLLATELQRESQLGAIVMLIYGDKLAELGRWKEAEKSYLSATRIDNQSAQAYNNVAWIMGNTEPYRLDLALENINRAIALEAKPVFFETRGQIMLKQERWQDAADDLENALNGGISPTDTKNAHASLAIAYQKLGKHELAIAHRDMGKLLLSD